MDTIVFLIQVDNELQYCNPISNFAYLLAKLTVGALVS